MTLYEVYATRWDNPHIVDELIPARNLEFSMPLSDHGECHFDAIVEPGWSSWRSSLTKDLSGLIVTRDGVPVWQGWVVEDQESGPRTFSFRAIEWGYFFSLTPAVPYSYTGQNDCFIFRDMIDKAQAITGQNVAVQTGSALGSSFSTHNINVWDTTSVEREFRAVAEAQGGPQWYFGTTGTLDNPVRKLFLGDRLGATSPAAFLEFVEDTLPVTGPEAPPTVQLLGSTFPGSPTQSTVPTRRAGGNVIAKARTRQGDSATIVIATDSGPQSAQIRQVATSSLIGRGWPAMTRVNSYSNVPDNATLLRRANADLAKAQGFATGYSLTTLDGDPDWTQVPRGSTVTVSLDTDVYAGPRPLEFSPRVLGITVRVPDAGAAQIQWNVATVQEV